MQSNDPRDAALPFNGVAEVPSVEPAFIERWWEVVNSIPREQRQHTVVGLSAVAQGDASLLSQRPELSFAIMFRCALLDGLMEQGILGNSLEDQSLRKKVFVAVASFPCKQSDVGVVLLQKLLR